MFRQSVQTVRLPQKCLQMSGVMCLISWCGPPVKSGTAATPPAVRKRKASLSKAALIKYRDHYAGEKSKSDLRQHNVFRLSTDWTINGTIEALKDKHWLNLFSEPPKIPNLYKQPNWLVNEIITTLMSNAKNLGGTHADTTYLPPTGWRNWQLALMWEYVFNALLTFFTTELDWNKTKQTNGESSPVSLGTCDWTTASFKVMHWTDNARRASDKTLSGFLHLCLPQLERRLEKQYHSSVDLDKQN